MSKLSVKSGPPNPARIPAPKSSSSPWQNLNPSSDHQYHTYSQPSNPGTSSGKDPSPKSHSVPRPEPSPSSGRVHQPRSCIAERRGETGKDRSERASASGEGPRDQPAAMRCGTRPAGFGLPGPTLPVSQPHTHSNPSPGLLRQQRAGYRRAMDASCTADRSRRPPPSARLRLELQFQL